MEEPEFKDGPCRWCGCDSPVFADNGLCEDCDGDTYHCVVCDEEMYDDSYDGFCRHLFRDANHEWQGSGTGEPPNETVRRSLLFLLQRMPPGFVADLKAAVEAGKFHTWMIAPLIGGGGILQLHEIELDQAETYGEAMIDLGEANDADQMHDGYRWLVSLYDGKTPEANRQTLQVIDSLQVEAGEAS